MSWYLARLENMRPAEMVWRASQIATLPLELIDRLRGTGADRFRPAAAWWERSEYPIFHHHKGGEFSQIRIFDLDFPAGFRFDWHRDYRNGKMAPQKFSRTLDIRNPEVVGDVKYIWEVNRHQHLSAIAFSGRPDAERIVSESIRSWIKSNPYLDGVNWTSSLELALRLISWALSYPLVRPRMRQDPEFREVFATSAYLHLRTIRNHFSLYSSANNHLIGELAGLYVGTVCFPWWKECEAWRVLALEMLEREIQLQFTTEGVNREQAVSYELFTLELLLLTWLVGRNSGDDFSAESRIRIRAALEYLATLATSAGDLPWFGDSDDARGFVVSPHESALQVVMQLGGILFKEERFMQFAEKTTAATLALMPNEFIEISKMSAVSSMFPATQFMQDGGVIVIQSGDWKLVMDVGPLGYTSIAAHGHADALSLMLAVGDRYILIDSGTYAYHSHPEWRSYFRGTAAHNTARVDGMDQSKPAGRFLWTSKASVRVTHFTDSGGAVRVEAEHDGYLHLPDPVLHRRIVEFEKEQSFILVEDSFVCKAGHDIEIHWHLSERVDIDQSPDGTLSGHMDGHVIAFSFSGQPCKVSVVRGANSPILGWRSPSFNRKIPIPTIRCALRVDGTVRFVTRIDLKQPVSGKG